MEFTLLFFIEFQPMASVSDSFSLYY